MSIINYIVIKEVTRNQFNARLGFIDAGEPDIPLGPLAEIEGKFYARGTIFGESLYGLAETSAEKINGFVLTTHTDSYVTRKDIITALIDYDALHNNQCRAVSA